VSQNVDLRRLASANPPSGSSIYVLPNKFGRGYQFVAWSTRFRRPVNKCRATRIYTGQCSVTTEPRSGTLPPTPVRECARRFSQYWWILLVIVAVIVVAAVVVLIRRGKGPETIKPEKGGSEVPPPPDESEELQFPPPDDKEL